ncbi:MAG: flavodoxin family protein [Candidatus Nanoarchaeia archaeon]
MKAIAFNGSPRQGGNTEIALKKVLNELSAAGIQTELMQIGGKIIRGCIACMACRKNLNRSCAIDDDCVNECIEKALSSEIIILGSPTYFSDVTAEMKALIDRMGYVTRGNGSLLKDKIGAAVVAVRRGGGIHAFDTMNHFFLISGMIVVGSTYWNLCYGREIGEVENDKEGLENMSDLGKRIAVVAKKLY